MEPTRPGPEDRAPPALADHLVEEIFVRVGDFADLARASAACKAFCRLITDSTFLRRYRTLHPLLLLGFLDHVPSDLTGFFIPAGAPHPNAPAARALAGGASDFRFFHLPHPHRQRFWSPCDTRHGHVLLAYCDDDNPMPFWSPELAVGDPLTGRNTLVLPPVPDNLLDSAPVGNNNTGDSSFNAFFDPSVSYNEAQFRVMWWSPSRGAIFIYSSVSNDWTLGASVDADLLEPQDFAMLTPQITVVSYVNGCLYWKHYGSDTLIKLNISSMEFSVIYLPSDYEDSPDIVVVEDGEGTIWICHLDCTTRNPPSYFIRQ